MHFTLTTHWTITLLTLLTSTPAQEPPKSTRTVKDNVLTSTEKPALQLKFDKAFKYIGSQTFILYGVAQAEQHFFVDADEKNQMRRFYWVQFEGYLPTNNSTYRYQSKTKAKLGPLEFFADAGPRNMKAKSRPDSDSAKGQAFLASKGYKLVGDDVMTQRLVHLVDDKKRDELMIIYLENLAPVNLTAADLSPGGKAAAQWPGIAEKLLQRSLQGMELVKD